VGRAHPISALERLLCRVLAAFYANLSATSMAESACILEPRLIPANGDSSWRSIE
jgi:hypothetical protein